MERWLDNKSACQGRRFNDIFLTPKLFGSLSFVAKTTINKK